MRWSMLYVNAGLCPVQHALVNAFDLCRCFDYSQVIVKLNSVEPEKLSPDVISATNRILSYG
jgi:hypothetical protein